MNEIFYYININSMYIGSIDTFANINGRFRNNNKDVYFVCKFGYDNETEYLKSIESMDKILNDNILLYNIGYNRINKLSNAISNSEAEKYISFFEEWTINGFIRHGKIDEYFKFASERIKLTVGKAFEKVMGLFQDISNGGNEVIRKNFGVKLFCWFDKYAKDLFINRVELGKTSKFVYIGELKQQGYLYLYFLALAGCDVLWLNPEGDCNMDKNLLKLASCNYGSIKRRLEISNYKAKNVIFEKESAVQVEQQQKYPIEIDSNCVKNINNTTSYKENINSIEIIRSGSSSEQVERPRIYIPPRNNVTNSVRIKGKENKTLSYEELAKIAASVVMISVLDKKGECYKAGSGVMIDERGYILTNFHVASGAASYIIRIEDDEKIYETDELVKYNDVLDLAIIRIDRRCKAVPIYKGYKELVRGQKVVAIGSPLGLFNSISDGIISGFRNVDYVSMVQFTAPISSGSSGGALLDLYGNLIGINSCSFDAGENLNFAIDYKTVLAFANGFVTT